MGGIFGSVARPDFSFAPGDEEVLLPANSATGKGGGMSFFIATCEAAAVVKAAHNHRGAAQGGCFAFPLATLPPELSLLVDSVQLADSRGTPVLLFLNNKVAVKAVRSPPPLPVGGGTGGWVPGLRRPLVLQKTFFQLSQASGQPPCPLP